MIIRASNVSFTYRDAPVAAVESLDLGVDRGELVALVGPNGSGKTTLLRVIAGVLKPTSGRVEIADRDVSEWSRRALAREVGVVSQSEEPAFPTRVHQSVLLGRYPYLGTWSRTSARDTEVVDRVLRECDAFDLRDRWTGSLSGGEWQRVRMARALAQEPAALILDEPTSNLDIRHEMELLELVAQLVSGGLASIIVTHNVNLAARFAHRIVVMDKGRAVASGTPVEVLTAELLETVFKWPVEIREWHGHPQFVPVRSDANDRG